MTPLPLEPLTIHQIVTLGAALQIGGPILAVLVIWWFDRRDIQKILKDGRENLATVLGQHQKQLEIYREDTQETLKYFKEYLAKVVQMYQDNAELVKDYHRVSSDFRAVVVTNTEVCANLNNSINHNLFCPLVRQNAGIPK